MCFALEAASRGRAGELVRKKLDRNRPIEIGIERPIDHTHATGAERRLHHVHAEPKAGQDRGRRLAHWLTICAATAARNASRSRDGRSNAEWENRSIWRERSRFTGLSSAPVFYIAPTISAEAAR